MMDPSAVVTACAAEGAKEPAEGREVEEGSPATVPLPHHGEGDRVDDVGVDRRHGRVDNLDSLRGQGSPELRGKQPVNTMVVEGEAHRRGSPEDIDSNQLRTTRPGKRILEGADVQRRRKELVGEIRVFLVVRYAIDFNLVEVIEGRSDTRHP